MDKRQYQAGSTLLELAISLCFISLALAALKTLEHRVVSSHRIIEQSIKQQSPALDNRNCKRKQMFDVTLLACTLSNALKDIHFQIDSP